MIKFVQMDVIRHRELIIERLKDDTEEWSVEGTMSLGRVNGNPLEHETIKKQLDGSIEGTRCVNGNLSEHEAIKKQLDHM